MNEFAALNALDAAHSAPGAVRPITPSQFRFVAVSDLEWREPEYIVEGLIETDTLGEIFGDPGGGKSFVAVDLGLSVATGQPFHGHKTMQGPVLFIAGEGHNGLARRFAAWSAERGTPLAGVPLFKSERAAQFLDQASATAVSQAADLVAREHGAPRLIIIDTVARNFGAGDENNTKDMSDFIAAMDDLKARYPGCVVMLVHHSGHADKQRARGAMALKGALDFEYRVEKDGNCVQLINTKMKDAEPPADMHFTLESVQLCGNAHSAVLRSAEAPERQTRRSPAQALALATYQAAACSQGIWNENGTAFLGVHIDDWRDAFYAQHTGDNAASKRQAFLRVRNDLVCMKLMSVHDDLYLVDEPTIQTEVYRAGCPGNAPSVTGVTERDIATNVTAPEAGKAVTSVTSPLGLSRVTPRTGG